MDRNVFEIEGLECAYRNRKSKKSKVVLCIRQLNIPMGKVAVILGPSGSGKSTLIETLGLMNHTISKGVIRYHDAGSTLVIDRDIWSRPSELARIRNRHFSFIFQHDFLMPHYSPEENMLIGQLIRETESGEPVDAVDLRQLCTRLGLNFDDLITKKPATLSVGQKQRLSFIRAIVKNASVIFGDEPTGNLDEANSELLMEVLNESIRQNSKQSAILVSHNIRMSVAKAGFIIVLSQQSGDRFEILPGHVFTRTDAGWINGDGCEWSGEALAVKIKEIACNSIQDCHS
jgi:ABC-type lipoprotein export system ATPase subunit